MSWVHVVGDTKHVVGKIFRSWVHVVGTFSFFYMSWVHMSWRTCAHDIVIVPHDMYMSWRHVVENMGVYPKGFVGKDH